MEPPQGLGWGWGCPKETFPGDTQKPVTTLPSVNRRRMQPCLSHSPCIPVASCTCLEAAGLDLGPPTPCLESCPYSG